MIRLNFRTFHIDANVQCVATVTLRHDWHSLDGEGRRERYTNVERQTGSRSERGGWVTPDVQRETRPLTVCRETYQSSNGLIGGTRRAARRGSPPTVPVTIALYTFTWDRRSQPGPDRCVAATHLSGIYYIYYATDGAWPRPSEAVPHCKAAQRDEIDISYRS